MSSRSSPTVRTAQCTALAALTLCSASCSQLTPNGQSSSISLLRAGSEKVCIASDVQQSLRDMILPKSNEIALAENDEARQTAIKTVSVSYDLTTLQSFDKAVTRASCSTTARISGSDGNSHSFALSYQVSPSAESSASLVVTGDTGEAHAFARSMVTAALEATNAEHEAQEQRTQQAQAAAALRSTVTPKWIVGSWIDPRDDAVGCSNGHALNIQANHSVEGFMATARWTLNGTTLHMVGQSPSGGIDKTFDITEADAISFKYQSGGGGTESLRRCTRAEVEGAAEGDDQ